MAKLIQSSIFYLFLLVLVFSSSALYAQGTWVWNKRTHSELSWQTLESANFLIHYHEGLYSTARDAAGIAEELWPILLQQIHAAHDYGKIHITVTAEDEIANGYVLPSNQVFIWVNQNEPAGHFTGSEKWLRTLIAHELQHIVLVNATRTWLGIWNFKTLPFWFIEGTAEYYTEKWRVGRSDSRLKAATFFNQIHMMDPHDDGFAKVLYLAEQFGDSAIAQIVHWRHPFWKTYSFEQAFRHVTGMSTSAFHEDWRKAMNTYYFSLRGQKESVTDVGELLSLPAIGDIYYMAISPDSSAVAYISLEPGKRYSSMFLQDVSTGRVRKTHVGLFRSIPSWTPDSKSLVIGEYRRGQYGSLIFDIRQIDTQRNKAEWLTRDSRANYPVFGSNTDLYYVTNLGRSAQIVYLDLISGKKKQLTQFADETHIRYLNISPDRKSLIFMIEDASGYPDLGIIKTDGTGFRKLTNDKFENLYPIWSSDASEVFFTSYRSGTPNIFAVDREGEDIRQLTDVYSGLYPGQVIPGSHSILASSIRDADTSQFVIIDPNRSVKNDSFVIREEYRNWRTHRPEIPIDTVLRNTDSATKYSGSKYFFYKNPRHLASLILPTPSGIAGFTAWTDPLGKNTLITGGEIGYQPFSQQAVNGLYGLFHTASFRPFLTFGVMKNTSHFLRGYNGGMLHENRNGISATATLPLNHGYSLYRNHYVQVQAGLIQRESMLRYAERNERPEPKSGREGILSFRYYYLTRLPEKVNSFLPNQGAGLSLQTDVADKRLYGEHSYYRLKMQLFKNQKIVPGLIAFIRVLAENIQGEYLPQDMPGFYNDFSFYPSGMAPFMLNSYTFISTRENYTLRVTDTSIPGETLLQGTFELRIPLVQSLPINFFVLSMGGMSFAPFFDYGMVQLNGQQTTMATAGVELKNEIKVGTFSALHLAYGIGQKLDAWKKRSHPDWYLKLGLVNPF